MITGVLFDLDETLLDRTGSLREFLSYQHARHPALAKTVFEHFLDRFMTLDNRGRTVKPAVYSKLLEEFGIVGQRFARTLFNEYECEFWRFAEGFSGLDQLFKNLKKKGIRTGIVTNGQTHIQSRSIAALKLDSRVDAVLISESEGLRKPEIEIFLRATTMIGLRPADCMFVGDSPLTDIVGAQRAGLKAIWFANGAEWPRDVASCPDAEIGSLDEILEVIDHFRE